MRERKREKKKKLARSEGKNKAFLPPHREPAETATVILSSTKPPRPRSHWMRFRAEFRDMKRAAAAEASPEREAAAERQLKK